MHQRVTLLTRDGIDLLTLRNAGKSYQDRNHGTSGKIKKSVFKFTVCVFFKIPQDTRVQLFFVKPRLEINLQAILMLFEVTEMCACGEHQRAGYAEMRKQHLAKFAV